MLLIAAVLIAAVAVARVLSSPSVDGEKRTGAKVARVDRQGTGVPAPPAAPAHPSPIPRGTSARPRRATAPVATAPPAAAKPPAAAHPAAPAPGGPRAAIVIDDLGQRVEHLEQLARLGLPLSIAVIPNLPASAQTVREAGRLGIEMLLHQPMEPHEEGGKNPGEGVLLVSMAPEVLRDQLRRGLATVPGAVGVNNHMGSRFTEDPDALGLLMAELKANGLFWLDSRTSAATQGSAAARAAGVPEIERDVFIDAERDADFIRGQLRKLLETARARGAAVGIGHPRAETFAVLEELRGELLSSGVTLVPVSRLVRAADAAPPGTTLAAAPARERRAVGAVRPESATP